MKNILRENMRRFRTKNLLSEQQSMAEPFRSAVERYRDAIATILNFAAERLIKDPRATRNIQTQLAELNKRFTLALDSMSNDTLRKIYEEYGPNWFSGIASMLAASRTLGQDGDTKFKRIVNTIEETGSALIKHVDEVPNIPATITPGELDQDTANDMGDDMSKIADLDSAIEMMNKLLPTIMVKK